MTGRTETRLRDATTALGQSVQPEDIPELRFPARAPAWRWRLPDPRSGGRLAATRFLVPLAAAVAVLALLAGLILGGKLLRSTGHGPAPVHPNPTSTGLPTPTPTPTRGAPTPSPSPTQRAVRRHTLHHQPRYLVMSVQGPGAIRVAATGSAVATIAPPERYFSIDGVAMAPGDRTFYLAGQVPTASRRGIRLDFFRVPLSASGRPGPAHRLPGAPLIEPIPITSDALIQLPLAISPDGTELAYPSDNQFFPDDYPARYPTTITVQNVITGARRTWAIWPASDTMITGVSWASGGKLGIVATLGNAAVKHGTVYRHPGTDLHAFLVLDTASAGASLAAASRVVAFSSYRAVHHGLIVPVTTGPTAGVISPDGSSAYLQIGIAVGAAELARVSVATGKVERVLLTRPTQPFQASPEAIDGRYLLIALGPATAPKPRPSYTCGGLAAVNVATGRVRRLPFPLHCSTAVPPTPVQVAW